MRPQHAARSSEESLFWLRSFVVFIACCVGYFLHQIVSETNMISHILLTYVVINGIAS